VNFLKKELRISFNIQELSLRKLVELLASIAYKPEINLDKIGEKKNTGIDRKLVYQLGIAGFCFGNIMLLSLPEYFGLDDIMESEFASFFGYINILLSLPVVLYSASSYYTSAFAAIRHKTINIDIPIFLGISVLFLRSSWEIISHSGAGYLDSLAGLVFFLLLGRVFQQKTYHTLSFERDYKSYFPVAVTKISETGEESSVGVSQLKVGDTILIRNQELVPVDGVLDCDEARIDNSFVSGESVPVRKSRGDKIYAGGRQVGAAITLKVLKELSSSYLTQLWNDDTFAKADEDEFDTLTDRMSRYFTVIILIIAISCFTFWSFKDIHIAFNAFTAVLIIACPCALALSAPFTLGNALRIMGRNQFYLKNASVIERLAKISTVVFDKTGTITQSSDSEIKYSGREINKEEMNLLYSLFRQSSHPLSNLIYKSLGSCSVLELEGYKEETGAGISCVTEYGVVRAGSARFIEKELPGSAFEKQKGTAVYVSIGNEYVGSFRLNNKYRAGLKVLIQSLQKRYKTMLISGDNDNEENNLKEFFGEKSEFLFDQSPQSKLDYIKSLQTNNEKTLMIGDGLNDAGAIKQSDIGISISEDVNTFSPACDAILDAKQFEKLPKFIDYARKCRSIIIVSFIISFLYNIVGMYFAVQGLLSPVFAAILMPISSITVVVFTTVTSRLVAQRTL
jgi:Cu+-exporting ATPase